MSWLDQKSPSTTHFDHPILSFRKSHTDTSSPSAFDVKLPLRLPPTHPLTSTVTIIVTSSSSSHPANPSLLPPRSHSKSIRLRELRKSAQKSRDPEIQIPERQPKTTTPSLTHSLTTSCSISLTRGTRVSCKPQNAATFSIYESINVSSRKPPSQVNQRCKTARKNLHTAAPSPRPRMKLQSASSLSNATPSPAGDSAS